MTNIVVTLNDSQWPELTLIVKCGTQVTTSRVRWDQATDKFSTMLSDTLKQQVQMQIDKRKDRR